MHFASLTEAFFCEGRIKHWPGNGEARDFSFQLSQTAVQWEAMSMFLRDAAKPRRCGSPSGVRGVCRGHHDPMMTPGILLSWSQTPGGNCGCSIEGAKRVTPAAVCQEASE